MEENASKCRTFKFSGSFPGGRPRQTWNEVISSDLKEKKASKNIAKDRNAWKSFIIICPTNACMENRR